MKRIKEIQRDLAEMKRNTVHHAKVLKRTRRVDAARQFDGLVEELCLDAADVPCSPKVYQDGLRRMIARLEADLEASEESNE